MTNTLRKFLLENNAGNYTLHALRHTHASLLLGNGFTIQYVSKRLGHANIEITWRVYSHLLEELKSEEDNKLDNALNFSCPNKRTTFKNMWSLCPNVDQKFKTYFYK